jgi:hypothetical protein
VGVGNETQRCSTAGSSCIANAAKGANLQDRAAAARHEDECVCRGKSDVALGAGWGAR